MASIYTMAYQVVVWLGPESASRFGLDNDSVIGRADRIYPEQLDHTKSISWRVGTILWMEQTALRRGNMALAS